MSILNKFPSGGVVADTLNATPSDVLSGYKFIGARQDEPETGTLSLTGNAQVNHVLNTRTFYNNDPKNRRTGTMQVNNISNFSLAVSSGRILVARWTNPSVISGRPFSGVYIRYNTGGYPTTTSGTQIYKGTGTTANAGAQSQILLTMPNIATTYYFICYSYCVTSNGELLGTQLRASIATGAQQIINFTAQSTNYTIPQGYTIADIFCVGGGGGGSRGEAGGSSWSGTGGGGGGGGYTTTTRNISVSAGQILGVTIGGGGTSLSTGSRNGGQTTVVRNGSTISSANGGVSTYWVSNTGTNGGSGGGAGGYYSSSSSQAPGSNGGSNGGNGGGSPAGTGQGSTTRAFGEASGALYAGAGAGGGGGGQSRGPDQRQGGTGGAGGGANGGTGGYLISDSSEGSNWQYATGAGSPTANTGGGGGGGGGGPRTSLTYPRPGGLSTDGATGRVILRLR